MLFFLLLMFRSICHQVSNQAGRLALLVIIVLLADVSPTYSIALRKPTWIGGRNVG